MLQPSTNHGFVLVNPLAYRQPLSGQISHNHNAYTRTSPNEMAPSLPMFSLQLELRPGDFPIALRESLHAPPRLVYPLSGAILREPRQYLV